MATLAQAPRAAFVTSPSSFAASELRPLVQSRMRLAATVGLVMLAILFISDLLLTRGSGLRAYLTLGLEVENLVAFGCATALLWLRPELSLQRLRRLDTLLVVSFSTYTAGAEYLWLIGAQVAQSAQAGLPVAAKNLWWILPDQSMLFSGGDSVFLISVSWALPWIILLTVYTTWMPNTLRGGLTLTALVFALAFAGTAAAALTRRELAGTYLTLGVSMLLFMTPLTVLGLAAAHKVESLRRQAYEARRLGQYTLERKLGEGGMGEVYLARHQFLRRPCAVKLIRGDAAEAHDSLVRFEREVQAMAALAHPNIVEIFDYGRSEEGTFYYVMEYLPGLSLEELVRRYGPLPPARAVYLLRQVCDALCEAHAVGLLHRDIKPSNILLCERGKRPDVAKLLDFGLVQRIGEHEAPPRPADAQTAEPTADEASKDALGEKVTRAGSLVGTAEFFTTPRMKAHTNHGAASGSPLDRLG